LRLGIFGILLRRRPSRDGYFFEAGLDRDCVGFLVEVDGGEPVGESKDPAEHSSLAGGDLVEEGRV
jgi:hypothetical protein